MSNCLPFPKCPHCSLVAYDEADLVALRDKCLTWQDRFVDRLVERRYADYLREAPRRAEAEGLFDRQGKGLSKCVLSSA